MSQSLLPIERAIHFIEDHLREEIAVADIAAAVHYSLFHFVRSFNHAVHHTPYDYLIRRRLTESAVELAHSNKRIIDLAREYSFHSPEVYSRAFKRMFGIQPNEYRTLGLIDPHTLLSRRTLAHLENITCQKQTPPARVEWGSVRLAGLISRPCESPEEQASLWTVFHQVLDRLHFPTRDLRFFGVTLYPDGWQKEGPSFMAAAAIESDRKVEIPLAPYDLAAGAYARFSHSGPLQTIPLTRDYIYQTWLPKSGLQLAQSIEIETFGRELPAGHDGNRRREFYLPLLSACSAISGPAD